MKLKYLAALFFYTISSLSANAVASDSAAKSDTPISNEALKEQYALSLKNQMKSADETHQKNIALLNRTESITTQQEHDIERFEKILDTWERQQAQYQKYLDSLPKK